MATGALDDKGVWQYGEDDSEPTFSELLNLGMSSISSTQFGLKQVVTFTSSGTFTKASYPWLRAIRVKVVGGGGGGGGAAVTGASTVSAGGGGGAGGYAESFITDIAGLAASVSVAVGAAGAGGAGTATAGSGLSSSFGTLVIGDGGDGGAGIAAAGVPAFGGTAGVGGNGTGDYVVEGNSGTRIVQQNASTHVVRTPGGNSYLGQATSVAVGAGNGFQPRPGNFGGGGSAAASAPSTGSTRSGGPGLSGVVIVELYA